MTVRVGVPALAVVALVLAARPATAAPPAAAVPDDWSLRGAYVALVAIAVGTLLLVVRAAYRRRSSEEDL